MDAPKEAGKLNDTIKVPGKAMQYNGVPIGGAKVRYRVVREVRYPAWFFEYRWWQPVPQKPAQEIAHGIVTTEPDGSFTVPFVAKPDLTVSEKDEPSFRYVVNADVTDTTGETRSASKSVNVGYVALRADREAVRRVADRSDKDVKRSRFPRPRSTARASPRRARSRFTRSSSRTRRSAPTSTAGTTRGSAPARPATTSRCPTPASR